MSQHLHANAIEDLADEFEQGLMPTDDTTDCGEVACDRQASERMAAASLPEVPQLAPFSLVDLVPNKCDTEKAPIDFLRDVELDLNIEFGRTELELEEIRRMRTGTVVALDRRKGELVDVVVNGQLIARGEVIVMDGKLCVRVSEVLASDAA